MALYGKGMLVTCTSVPPQHEDDFNAWYDREHVDERVNMPGFHRARRYVDAIGNARIKYFATYETDRVEDLATPDYMALLADQSDWSKRVMQHFTDFERLTLRITSDHTHGISGALGVARFRPAPDRQDGLRAHLDGALLLQLAGRQDVAGACLGENDLETDYTGRRAQGRAVPTGESPEWVVLVDGADRAACAAALEAGFGAGLPAFGLARDAIRLEVFRFTFGNNR